jgi:outer membrane protein insertion porin family
MSDKLQIFFLFILMTFFSSLDAANAQYENQPVERLEIIIETRTGIVNQTAVAGVKSRMTTQEGGFFTQADFDNDLKVLSRDYDKIEPQLQFINGAMHIVMRVWTRPQIRTINWCGNKHIECADLRKELDIKPLSTFDRQVFNKSFHKIKALYVKKGYFEAQLSYEIVRDCETNEVDIQINICEGRAGHIKEIIFCGFTKDEESDLLDLFMTKEYSYIFSWYTGEGLYHEEGIQQDQFVAVNFLQNKGYADARVSIEVTEACRNMINVHINASRGEIYTVNQIEVSGNTLFCDDEVREVFTFDVGSPYSPEDVRETIGNITDLYGRKGYIDTSVDLEPSLDIETNSYSLKLTIDEGQQFRVGMLKVFGNNTTQTSIILHESLLIPGEVFNIEKLKLTEQKLTNVGYFESVNVFAVKSDGPLGLGECYRDVHIEVKETSTGHFGAFFGYSTAESIFGGLNITEKNFSYRGLGCAWKEGFAFMRGGGEYAHATVQIGLKSRKYIASWAKPFFNDTPWTVGFDIERSNNRYISDDYEINSWALITHATYKVNQFMHFGWHYRIKNSDVVVGSKEKPIKRRKREDIEKSILEMYKDSPLTRAEVKEKIKKERSKETGREQLKHDSDIHGLISASGVSFTYDSTDHPVTPRCGFKSRFEGEFAGIGGDHTFLSFGYLNSYYIPVDKKSILKFRGDFRFIVPIGCGPFDLPIDERLFLGGDALVRGYRSYRLGPQYTGLQDPRGGITMQYYSMELTRRLHHKVEAFMFCDAGYLSRRRFGFSMPACAIGVGARIKIIESIPSVTFGYGIPLNPRKPGDVKKFFISLGGQF